jgi:hypothetical protein
MTSSIYSASVPVFKQMLTALSDVLKKAEAHVTEKNIEPNALLQARLFPDMFPLVRQVQIAADFAKGISSRLAGVEVPSWPDTEVTFADLQALNALAIRTGKSSCVRGRRKRRSWSAAPICKTMACRSSSSTLRRPTRFCATTVSKSASATIWDLTDRWRMG